MTTRILLLLLVILSVGCATNRVELLDEVVSLNEPHRIIVHDFNEKYGLVYEVKPETVRPVSQPMRKPNHDKPVLKKPLDKPLSYIDIHFYNESAAVPNKLETINKIKQALDTEYLLIVGHSHGKSLIGVQALATKRAYNLSNALEAAGIPKANMYLAGSWSDGSKKHGLSKGVRVIGLPSKLDQELALIIGLSSTGEKI